MVKTFQAFLITPFPAALFQSIVVALWPKPGMGVFENPASMFVLICLYGYIFGALLGLPAAIWLRRRGVLNLKAYALAGSAVWLAPIMTGLGLYFLQGGLSLYVAIYNLTFVGIGGTVAGILYWRLSRPDRRRQQG